MITQDMPKVGEVYSYNSTGKHYEIKQLCMIKTYKPDTENGWSKGVMYEAVVSTPLQTSSYVRELEDFSLKFTKVES